MRRRQFHRIVALPLALWFVALATDLGGVDACPMHDAMMHGMSGVATMQMAMPSAHVVTTGQDTPQSPTPPGPMQCTCMGLCCGCAMATVPTAPVAPTPAVVGVRTMEPTLRTARPRVVAARYLLPPAIGPPSHSAV